MIISPNKPLILSSDPKNLNLIERIIQDICELYDIPEDAFGNILIAVTEAVNNAIYHGNKADPKKSVYINFYTKNNQLIFSIKDEGIGFDFQNLPNPTLPDNIQKIGGRGIFIIYQLADKVNFKDNGKEIEIAFAVQKFVG